MATGFAAGAGDGLPPAQAASAAPASAPPEARSQRRLLRQPTCWDEGPGRRAEDSTVIPPWLASGGMSSCCVIGLICTPFLLRIAAPNLFVSLWHFWAASGGCLEPGCTINHMGNVPRGTFPMIS